MDVAHLTHNLFPGRAIIAPHQIGIIAGQTVEPCVGLFDKLIVDLLLLHLIAPLHFAAFGLAALLVAETRQEGGQP